MKLKSFVRAVGMMMVMVFSLALMVPAVVTYSNMTGDVSYSKVPIREPKDPWLPKTPDNKDKRRI